MAPKERTGRMSQNSDKRSLTVLSKSKTVLSPWVTLTEAAVSPNPDGEQIEYFHYLEQQDYVSVLALTVDGRFVLVQQFRPAVERDTLELPGGLVDPGELPDVSAARELFEETGFSPVGELKPLGNFSPDTGRLANRFWGYFATVALQNDCPVEMEPELKVHLVTQNELVRLIETQEFDHSLHISLISIAAIKGLIPWM